MHDASFASYVAADRCRLARSVYVRNHISHSSCNISNASLGGANIVRV